MNLLKSKKTEFYLFIKHHANSLLGHAQHQKAYKNHV